MVKVLDCISNVLIPEGVNRILVNCCVSVSLLCPIEPQAAPGVNCEVC